MCKLMLLNQVKPLKTNLLTYNIGKVNPMKTCPKCKLSVPDFDWNCPKCGYHFPPLFEGTGHACSGKEEKDDKFKVSKEDISMLRDKNHQVKNGDDDLGFEPDQPYSSKDHGDY